MAPSFKNCTHTGEFHGGSLQGEIEATYADLVTLFGPPNGGDGYKVDAEWNLLFDDGTVANIYNYKDGINYNGAEEGTPTQKITNWHIGGQSPKAVLYVRQLLEGLPPAPAPAPAGAAAIVEENDYMEKPRAPAELEELLRKMGGYLIQQDFTHRLVAECGPGATLVDAMNLFFQEFEIKVANMGGF